MMARWVAVGRCCENCGRPIAYPSPTNFPHRKSRNTSTKSEIEKKFFVTCANLHRFQETWAKNLKADPCVDQYIDTYGEEFWPERLSFTPEGMP